MQRPTDNRAKDARFQALLETEKLVFGAILLMTVIFGLKALLF
jgi:hypothetical protein